MELSEQERTVEIEAATADVCDLAREVQVFANTIFDDRSPVGAMWFRPGPAVVPDDRIPAEVATQMNASAARGAHRVVAPAHPSDRVVFAGLLRHELEHARQFDLAGAGVFDIQDYLEESVLPEVAGGLNGCAGGLINSIPSEMDANAAASVYLSSRFAEEQLQPLRVSDRRALACSRLAPASPSTLLVRMTAFTVIHQAGVEAHAARTSFTPAAILRSVHTDLGRLWGDWVIQAS